MQLWRTKSTVAITVSCLVTIQVIFVIQIQRSYIKDNKDHRTQNKFEQFEERRQIFPRFNLEEADQNWRHNALLSRQTAKSFKRNLTIGIVTTQRPNGVIYLFKTLNSLITNAEKKDFKDIYIVILLADNDEQWRLKVSSIIHKTYPDMIHNGTIRLLQSFIWMYPKLENLTHHYIGHSDLRVKWKAKQNIDFAFLWLYVYKEKMSDFYLHLEDDVITISGYINIISEFIASQKQRWTCLEFSELGMIAKLYHTYDLESLAKMVALFYEEQPADFTYLNFNPQMLQFRRIIRKPTLFQHIGRNSSLPGKIMLVKDRFFTNELSKQLKGDNPSATIETNLRVQQGYPPESAYDAGFGFFWSEASAQKGDYFRIQFKSPQNVSRIIVVSGMNTVPTDIFQHAVLEVSSSVNKTNSCHDYRVLGQFINGTIKVNNISSHKLHCVQIRVEKPQNYWVIIQEIAIYIFR